MLKQIIATLAVLAATSVSAADANRASQAELEKIKGIGPAISQGIVDERKKQPFKDWNDLVVRVNGIGEKSASEFSAGGLRVNGKAYSAPSTGTKAANLTKSAGHSAAEAGRAVGHGFAESGRQVGSAAKDSTAAAGASAKVAGDEIGGKDKSTKPAGTAAPASAASSAKKSK